MSKRILSQKWRYGLLPLLAVLLGACNLLTVGGGGGNAITISGAPVVQLVSPPPNAAYRENVAVPIQALISNAGADIDRVEIAVDGAIVSTLPKPNESGLPSFSISQSWQPSGVGTHSISVTAFRADGSSSSPVSVTISVVGQNAIPSATPQSNGGNNGGSSSDPTATPGSGGNNGGGQQAAPSATTAPSNTPAPTAIPASPTPSTPVATFNQGVNVRGGPSTLFGIIGSFAAGQTTNIVAKTPAGDWYKVKYYNGEGWVFGQLLTVSGDASLILTDAGPPIPTLTPVPPTAVPVTATPTTNINLVAGNIRIEPANPVCNQTFNIFIDVANLGTSASPSGSISVRDIRVADGSVNGTGTTGSFGNIQPGVTGNSGGIPLTIGTFTNEKHKLVLVIDPNNQIAETNESDNTREFEYTLAKGSCP